MRAFFTEMIPYKIVALVTLAGVALLSGLLTVSMEMQREQGRAEVYGELPIQVLITIPIKRD